MPSLILSRRLLMPTLTLNLLLAACSSTSTPADGGLQTQGRITVASLPVGEDAQQALHLTNAGSSPITFTALDSLGSDGAYEDSEGLLVYAGDQPGQTFTVPAQGSLDLPVTVSCPVEADSYTSILPLQVTGGALLQVPVAATCVDRDIPDVVSKNVHVLPQTGAAQVRSYDPATGTLIFASGTSFATALQAGDSVVSGAIPFVAPDGLQVTLSSVTRQADGSVAAQTQAADLSDLFESFELDEKSSPTPQNIDWSNSVSHLKGLTLIRPMDAEVEAEGTLVNFNFKKVLASDEANPDPNNSLTVNGTFKVDKPEFDLGAKLDVKYKWKVIPVGVSFEGKSTLKFVESATLDVNGKLNFDKESRVNIATLNFNPKTIFIGAIPIIVRDRMDIFLDLKALAQGEVKYEARQGYSLKVGAEYKNGSLNQIFEQQRSFSQILDLKGSAEVRGQLGMRYTSALYGMVDFYGEAKFGPRLQAKAEDSKVNWKVDLCADAKAGFDDVRFNLKVKTFKIDGKSVDILRDKCYDLGPNYSGSFDLPAQAPEQPSVRSGTTQLQSSNG
ncbi:hypothetical protein [Deinococcus sp. UYEF24]